MRSKYSSYYLNDIADGCKYCVKGEKLVIFISGICDRNCYYCSLSEKRKNIDIIYANERKCKSPDDAIKEAIVSHATSAGITGGDPFLFMNRTLKYVKALKKRFGKSFHIHIYLPTKHLTEDKLKEFSKYIDEVRFHPDFLSNNRSDITSEINKIKIATKFWKKHNIGLELPMIPEKKKEILDFLVKIQDSISFVNFNELELSETNFNIMTRSYKFNDTGYVIKNSKPAGLWIIEQLKKKKSRLKLHFCTADLKNQYQYMNRLRLHDILPFGHRTKYGTVIYLTITKKQITSRLKKILKRSNSFYDKEKNRYIISEKLARTLLNDYEISRIEEFPTYDRIEIEKDIL